MAGVEANQQDSQSDGDIGGQKNVKHHGRQRNDHQRQYADQPDGNIDIRILAKIFQFKRLNR